MEDSLRDLFLLDPSLVLLNNGSFGAVPKPVMEEYFNLQRRLESHPHSFIVENISLRRPRPALAEFVGTAPENLAFVTNATGAINVVARSIKLGAGDEVLTTNQEYGAVDRTWRFLAGKRGFRMIHRPISLPVTTPERIVDELWQGVTPHTRVILFSHITSNTALILPAEEICRRARMQGILTVIDGAHVPGQLDLNIDRVGADFYAGNLHKWACSPKGTAFLYARPEVQHLIEPLVVSWSWEDPYGKPEHWSRYVQEIGTRDPSRFLAVPAALEFMRQHDWPAVRARCHALADQAQRRITDLTGLPPPNPLGDGRWFGQMVACQLPAGDSDALLRRLFDEFKIEVALVTRNGMNLLRVSIAAYTTADQVDCLVDALRKIL